MTNCTDKCAADCRQGRDCAHSHAATRAVFGLPAPSNDDSEGPGFAVYLIVAAILALAVVCYLVPLMELPFNAAR